MPLFILTALFAAAAPLGDSIPDPLGRIQAPASSSRVDSIVVTAHGALEGSRTINQGDSLAYQWAEWFRDSLTHSRTTAETIRKRLGFQVGDTLDSLRLSEGERLLRTEHFLADAKVSTTRLSDGRNLVRVETWDRWSTTLPAGINRSGGELSWLLGVREADLLGTGQDVGFTYNYTSRARSWTEYYSNSAFLTPGGSLQVSWSEVSDGHLISASTGLPVRSVFQDWSWLAEFQDQLYSRRVQATQSLRRTLDQRYSLGWTSDSWFSCAPNSELRTARATLTRMWGTDTRLHASLIAESELDSAGDPYTAFSFDTAQLSRLRNDPDLRQWLRQTPQRDDRRLGASITVKRIGYSRRRNFNQLKWTEDIPTGWQLTFKAMANVLSNGDVRDDGYLQAVGSWTGIAGNIYATDSVGWKSFFKGGDAGRGTSAWKGQARWLADGGVQLIAGATSQQILGVPAWQYQLTLGEDNGLPGYPARYLSGRGLFLATSELRWALPLEALTVAPALALVAGAGRVSDDARPFGAGPWREGIGFGLRLGMTRSPTALVNHLTLSRPVGRDGKLGWLLSFGAKQSL
jgi:hypothetical protein